MLKLKHYIITLLALSSIYAGCESWDFEEASFLNVTTVEAAYGSANSFDLKGQLQAGLGSELEQPSVYGFCWSLEDPSPTLETPSIDTIGFTPPLQGDFFEANINDLVFDTIYHFRAYARTEERVFYGNVISRQTNRIQLTTDSISVVNDQTLRVIGTILGLKEMRTEVKEYGHCVSSSGNLPTVEDNDGISSLGNRRRDGVFESTLSNLQSGVTYIIRSYAVYEPLNKVYYSDSASFTINNIWATKGDIRDTIKSVSGTRFGGVGFSLNGKGYIGAGYIVFINRNNLETSAIRNDLWEYDLANDSWREVGTFDWTRRMNGVSFTIGNTAYIGLGFDSLTNRIFSNFWEFDGNQARPINSPFPGEARSRAVGFSFNNRGYVGFGEDRQGNKLNDFWEFDPSTNPAWRQIPGIPNSMARSGATAFVVDGLRAYVGLGVGSGNIFKKDFYEFLPNSGTPFKSVPDFPGKERRGAVGFSIDGKGYVGTGEDDARITYVDFYTFDPSNSAYPWSRLDDLPGQIRTEAISLEVNGRAFVGTGLANFGDVGYTVTLRDWFEYIP